jgi:site-specific recombinase XerD
MLVDLYPRLHRRFSSLPLLGPYVDDFVAWLSEAGYPRVPIRCRIRALPRVDRALRRRGVKRIRGLSAALLVGLAPKDSQDDINLNATVRSLARFFEARGLLGPPPPRTRSTSLVDAYRVHLVEVRGLARSTIAHHASTVTELLEFLRYDAQPRNLKRLRSLQIESFLTRMAPRFCREGLQHVVAQVRSFLRFLVGKGVIPAGLESAVDTARTYRGERLPRSLPWSTIQSFLAAIDRSTSMGRRDYAMFLLITTYGLRTSEVAALRLDEIDWRAGRLCVPRMKTATPIMLPLTREVGAAIAAYLRRDRPKLSEREVFLRVRAPAGRLKPTAVTEAFQAWTRRSGLAIPFQGPHCLRHSLAVHLLRQGTSLKAIGDLLGHRTSEATCVYLRLHVDDLRDAALEVPVERDS